MAKTDKKGLEVTIEMPAKVEAKVQNGFINIKGPKGENKRNIANPLLAVGVTGNKITLSTKTDSKSEKKLIYAYEEHIKNLVRGAAEGHKYVLKICAGHFPMNVSMSGTQLIVKNYLGEKFPRTLAIKPGVNVKVEGDKINVESVDKELAGTTAAAIEQLTKRPNFDMRIFQDGIYIIIKDGNEIK